MLDPATLTKRKSMRHLRRGSAVWDLAHLEPGQAIFKETTWQAKKQVYDRYAHAITNVPLLQPRKFDIAMLECREVREPTSVSYIIKVQRTE